MIKTGDVKSAGESKRKVNARPIMSYMATEFLQSRITPYSIECPSGRLRFRSKVSLALKEAVETGSNQMVLCLDLINRTGRFRQVCRQLAYGLRAVKQKYGMTFSISAGDWVLLRDGTKLENRKRNKCVVFLYPDATHTSFLRRSPLL